MTTKRTAFVFPGQGSQFIGMGKDLAEKSEQARKTFETANAILGRDITKIMFEGPEDDLKQTVNTQPAILACSIAAFDELKARGVAAPALVAGHSLGEYSALYAAGVLDLETVLRLVKFRGELMQHAGEKAPGAMAAILGLDDDKLAEICAAVAGPVVIANYNSPGQTVISGAVDAVNAAIEQCKAAGAKRALPLPVSGAFHSPLMEGPARELAAMIEQTHFADPAVPVVTNVDAKPTTSGQEVRQKLVDQMTGSVRWTQTVGTMTAAGIEAVVEVGPGKVLAGLIKRIAKDLPVTNAGTVAEIEAIAPV
ncbi:MAG: ACP S-malonyltransferase [Candidatus Sumerlaeaceae bacterium]|nr:ACP S-malonyltransferase [Candidatus Sumerlaeaceae bacterium]